MMTDDINWSDLEAGVVIEIIKTELSSTLDNMLESYNRSLVIEALEQTLAGYRE